MSKFTTKLKISFKNTIPTYLIISVFTLFFLFPDSTMLTFSRFGESLLSKILFSLAFNLLYFIPQFTSIFLGLHMLKNKSKNKISPESAKWFLRIPTPLSVITTTILILTYYFLGFFPDETNQMNLYIIFVIIIILNSLFSLIMTINIYSVMKTKLLKKELKT